MLSYRQGQRDTPAESCAGKKALNPLHTSNNVEATGNKVASCFENVASTLLLVWTGL